MAANENKMLFPAQFDGNLLGKSAAARSHENDMRCIILDRFHGGKDGIRLHDHSWTSTIRRFIRYMVFVGCPISYIQTTYPNQKVLLRLFKDTFGKSSL